MYFWYTAVGTVIWGKGGGGGGQRNTIRCSSGIQIVGTLFWEEGAENNQMFSCLRMVGNLSWEWFMI